MSIAARYSGTNSAISCDRYSPPPGSKRCRHYLQGGSCARPDQLLCVEWQKVNGKPPQNETEKSEVVVQQAFFGPPTVIRSSVPSAPEPPRPRIENAEIEMKAPLVRNLTDEQVASFKALGVAVCLESETIGRIWIVPEYTDNDRLEISVEHAATLSALCTAFPGAAVTAFQKLHSAK